LGHNISVGLHKAAEVAVEAARADLGMNLIGNRAPLLPRLVICLGGQLMCRAIECNPSHDLRMNEGCGGASDLPNAFVRLFPSGRQIAA
jgi:hypothetical protein